MAMTCLYNMGEWEDGKIALKYVINLIKYFVLKERHKKN